MRYTLFAAGYVFGDGVKGVMKEVVAYMQLLFAAVGSWLGWVLGGYDGFLYALLMFVIADYLTGVMCAFVERRLSSDIGFRGIAKEVLIFTLVGIGHILDSQVIGNGWSDPHGCDLLLHFQRRNSILEHAARIGLPIPRRLQDVLTHLSDERDDLVVKYIDK